jgi:hypothetical protein
LYCLEARRPLYLPGSFLEAWSEGSRGLKHLITLHISLNGIHLMGSPKTKLRTYEIESSTAPFFIVRLIKPILGHASSIWRHLKHSRDFVHISQVIGCRILIKLCIHRRLPSCRSVHPRPPSHLRRQPRVQHLFTSKSFLFSSPWMVLTLAFAD